MQANQKRQPLFETLNGTLPNYPRQVASHIEKMLQTLQLVLNATSIWVFMDTLWIYLNMFAIFDIGYLWIRYGYF